ncbi:NAD(P)/FAD-dependent oxidoreductase [Agrobacterium tumefaciens]|uniref:NAD(P)/FAD-dependent oxidoreductase n=1 Tax=Agrobacterium tumefaciens TaxID=358 RepID=UPI000976D3AF|nr:hypothetical protein BV900_22275 [Agrobacterium tumefaciens]
MTSREPYDLAIVGSGIMGLCAAFIAATSESYQHLVVIDQNGIGSGASGYAPGIQISVGRGQREQELAVRGTKFWQEMYPGGSWPVGRNCKLFWLTRSVSKIKQMSTTGEMVQSSRAEVNSQLSSLPGLAVPDGVGVVSDQCSYSPVKHVVLDLARRLRACGVTFEERFNVASITQRAGMMIIQAPTGVELLARRVIVAIGPWLPNSPLREALGRTPVVRVKKVVSLHLAVKPSPSCPAIGLVGDYAFLIPMIEEGYWLFSFTSEEWDVRPNSDELKVSEDDVARAYTILANWFPSDAPKIASSRVFCDCYSTDTIPFAHPAHSMAGVAIVGGGAGNGFRFGPGCAKDALEIVRNYPRNMRLPT